MDLVVGRVVKAHGVTGEVVVDIRTDDPDSRFAPGTRLRGRPSRGGAERDYVVDRRARTAGGCWCGSTASPTATPPTRCAAPSSSSTPRICRRSTIPTSTTTTSSRGCGCGRSTGGDVGNVAEVLHTAAGELLSVRRRGARSTGAVRRRDRHVGVAGGRDHRDRSARGPAGAGVTDARVRIDVVTIFPEYLDPLRQSLPGKAIDAGIVAARGARSAPVDPRRAPVGRRLAVRRRPRHGDEGAGVGRGARRNLFARKRFSSFRRPRAGCSPRPTRSGGAPRSTWCSHAVDTRASINVSSTTPPAGCGSRRCRSATTCWPAASRRRW